MRIWKPFQKVNTSSTCTDLLYDELKSIVDQESTSSYLLCSNREGYDILAVGEKAVAILEEFQARMAKQLDPMDLTDSNLPPLR